MTLISTRSLIASAIALGAVVAGSAAHAGTDVKLVIDVNTPHRYVQSAPVFVQHQQIRRGGMLGDADRDGVPNKFDRDSRFYNARAAYRHAQWGDFDRDGIVNQFDRAPRNPRRH